MASPIPKVLQMASPKRHLSHYSEGGLSQWIDGMALSLQLGPGQFKCPLCPTDYFRPTKLYKLRSHLNKTHDKNAVVYRGMKYAPCYEGCHKNKSKTHYHCHCGTLVSRKNRFKEHLLSKMHMFEMSMEEKYQNLSTGEPVMVDMDTDDDSYNEHFGVYILIKGKRESNFDIRLQNGIVTECKIKESPSDGEYRSSIVYEKRDGHINTVIKVTESRPQNESIGEMETARTTNDLDCNEEVMVKSEDVVHYDSVVKHENVPTIYTLEATPAAGPIPNVYNDIKSEYEINSKPLVLQSAGYQLAPIHNVTNNTQSESVIISEPSALQSAAYQLAQINNGTNDIQGESVIISEAAELQSAAYQVFDLPTDNYNFNTTSIDNVGIDFDLNKTIQKNNVTILHTTDEDMIPHETDSGNNLVKSTSEGYITLQPKDAYDMLKLVETCRDHQAESNTKAPDLVQCKSEYDQFPIPDLKPIKHPVTRLKTAPKQTFANSETLFKGKTSVKKALQKVANDHNYMGAAADDGATNKKVFTNTSFFFETRKFLGPEGEDEQCLLCGELFISSLPEVQHHHLLTVHLEEFEDFHHYSGQYEAHCSAMLMEDLNQKDSMEVEPATTEGSQNDCIPDDSCLKSGGNSGGLTTFPRSKPQNHQMCLLCNVSKQNMANHMKSAHPAYELPNERHKNAIVGKKLLGFIEENKVRFESETGFFHCCTCEMRYDDQSEMSVHVLCQHPNRVYSCSLCSTSFQKNKWLVQHMVEEHKSIRKVWFLCQICGMRFINKSHLKQHKAESHGEGFACPVEGCETLHYSNIKDFKLHLIRDHMGQKKSDPQISDARKCPDDKVTHKSWKTETKALHKTLDKYFIFDDVSIGFGTDNCKLCAKSFPRLQSGAPKTQALRKHLEILHMEALTNEDETNNDSKIFECSDCGQKLLSAAALQNHMDFYHDDFTCPYSTCGKKYNTHMSLQSHLRRQHGPSTSQCPYCGKEFKDNLQQHIDAVHKKKKSHTCPFEGCTKTFGTNSTLKIHMRIHTGEKPLKCNYCDFRGRQRNSIRVHMKVHHPDQMQIKEASVA